VDGFIDVKSLPLQTVRSPYILSSYRLNRISAHLLGEKMQSAAAVSITSHLAVIKPDSDMLGWDARNPRAHIHTYTHTYFFTEGGLPEVLTAH